MCGLAAHTARNLSPILEVLRLEFRDKQEVLEIGSGSGQHATEICAALRHLSWQTSDRISNHQTIQAWLDSAGVANVKSPLTLDVLDDSVPPAAYDAVFSANTAHIMNIVAVEKMFEIVAGTLRRHGRFCLYGPFRVAGQFNSESNAEFHHALLAKNPGAGIRHLEKLDEFGQLNGLKRSGSYAMPSNNMLIVWERLEEVGRCRR